MPPTGAAAGLLAVALVVVALTLRPQESTDSAPSTPVPGTTAAGTPATTSSPTAPDTGAWGRNSDLVALFPDLLPAAPGDTGYQGAHCTDLDVLNNGGAPAVECTQADGLTYYVWSFRRGDPRRDSTFATEIANDTTREQSWSRSTGSGRMRWSHYPGANTGLLTVSFDDPARAWVVVDVSWPHHTGQDIVDRWWAAAPV